MVPCEPCVLTDHFSKNGPSCVPEGRGVYQIFTVIVEVLRDSLAPCWNCFDPWPEVRFILRPPILTYLSFARSARRRHYLLPLPSSSRRSRTVALQQMTACSAVHAQTFDRLDDRVVWARKDFYWLSLNLYHLLFAASSSKMSSCKVRTLSQRHIQYDILAQL